MDFTDGDNFYKALSAKVNVAKVGDSNGSHGVTSEFLYQKWFISTEEDRITVQHTKQRGIRKILHPSLSQRFNTNDRALRYNRMQHSVFADTIQAVTVSSRGNQYAQVYSTNFGWSRSHPMNRKGDAHETLYLFLKDIWCSTQYCDGWIKGTNPWVV